ncbi:unnamed protein product [Protopolystoma xenopodis]|uniref:Uncharacterized protein n=1 Tax=Protopolystoma xenopodis TaxID=117903 RepID=A0A448WZ79_9PLAT|nr:unnamed protein product [Protopolystoma xenopodis]
MGILCVFDPSSNYQPASSRSREDPPSNPSHSYDADEDRSRGYSSKGRFSRTKGLSIRAGAGTGTSSSHTGSPSTANSTSEEKVIWTPNRAHNHRPQGYSSMRKTQLHKNDP